MFDERAFAAHFNEHEPIGELNNNDAGGSYVKLNEEFHQRNRPSLLYHTCSVLREATQF